MDKPSIGRIVHYVHLESVGQVNNEKPEHLAAIVVRRLANSNLITLVVFSNTGQIITPAPSRMCQQDEDSKEPGTWHWPERE